MKTTTLYASAQGIAGASGLFDRSLVGWAKSYFVGFTQMLMAKL